MRPRRFLASVLGLVWLGGPCFASTTLAGGTVVIYNADTAEFGEAFAKAFNARHPDVTIILYSARWKTMTVAIYEYLLADLLGPASALGTLLTLEVLASMLAANKLLGRTLGSLFRMV